MNVNFTLSIFSKPDASLNRVDIKLESRRVFFANVECARRRDVFRVTDDIVSNKTRWISDSDYPGNG